MNGSTTDYYYDSANRLYQVINWEHGNYDYEWDNNGNLLSDEVYTYSYDYANRLVGVSGAGLSISYDYNGLGDRLSQTANSVTTQYALDMAAGLTQVLDDETNAYLYGVGRIGEEQPDGWQYYLGDALGSVRQLSDEAGEISLAKFYLPFGEAITGAGGAASAYGYTGESVDEYTNLVFLWARWYAPYLNPDQQVVQSPMKVQFFSSYCEANPLDRFALTDP